MTAGTPLSQHLIRGMLVPEPPAGSSPPDGEWIGQLLQQLEESVSRAKQVHYKALGAILVLQERIAGAWRASGAGAPAPSGQ